MGDNVYNMISWFCINHLPSSFIHIFFCIFFYTLYANSSIPIRGESYHVFFLSDIETPFNSFHLF